MKRFSYVQFVALLLSVTSLNLVSMAQDEFLRVDTAIIKIPVLVYGRDGRLVTGLKRENFTVLENGVKQDVLFFETGESPITVMLLADLSGSMNEHKVQMGRALDVFIRLLRPIDTVVIATFDSATDIDIRVEPTLKKDYTRPKPASIRRGESPFTITFDAVDQAIKYMSRLTGRRAIVLFGDGEPWGLKATASSNLRDAEEAESTFFTIRYGEYPVACVLADPFYAGTIRSGAQSTDVTGIITSGEINVRNKDHSCAFRKNEIPKLIENVNSHFYGLAERTAGKSYNIRSIDDMTIIFRQIIAELGQQFSIGFEPKEPGREGERRKITVKVNIPNVAVRSRNEVVYKKAND